MSATKITLYTELAKENGEVKIITDRGQDYFIAQVKSDGHIIEQRLIPTETNPEGIRTILTELANYHQKILEIAKSTIVVQNFN